MYYLFIYQGHPLFQGRPTPLCGHVRKKQGLFFDALPQGLHPHPTNLQTNSTAFTLGPNKLYRISILAYLLKFYLFHQLAKLFLTKKFTNFLILTGCLKIYVMLVSLEFLIVKHPLSHRATRREVVAIFKTGLRRRPVLICVRYRDP